MPAWAPFTSYGFGADLMGYYPTPKGYRDRPNRTVEVEGQCDGCERGYIVWVKVTEIGPDSYECESSYTPCANCGYEVTSWYEEAIAKYQQEADRVMPQMVNAQVEKAVVALWDAFHAVTKAQLMAHNAKTYSSFKERDDDYDRYWAARDALKVSYERQADGIFALRVVED